MEIHQLEYLVAVAEEGGFTRASERLLVAQPSLSQQIKKLEQEVGRPLFDRLPRGVVPTEAGQRLLEHARKVLAELSDARRRVAEVGEAVTGSLAIGAIPTIAPSLLPGAVQTFLGRWPGVRFTLTEDVTARLLDALQRGELDLAVTSSTEPVAGVHVEKIGEEALYLVLPRDHRLARRRRVPWAAVAGEQFLVLHDMHCLAGQVQEFCRPHGVRPGVVARGAQLSTIAAMVSAGLGVSVVPAMFRAADAGGGRVYRPFTEPRPRRDLCVAWSLFRYRTNAARAFVEIVRRRIKRPAAGTK